MKTSAAALYILAIRRKRLGVGPFLAAPFVALAVIWFPRAAALSVGLASTAIAGAANPILARRVSAQLIALLLVGYAFCGKAFAYLGVEALYVGEVVLFSAGVLAVASKSVSQLHRSGVFYAILPLLAWCACRTVPYVETYGWNALRDAAVWGYSLFGLIVAALVRSRTHVEKIVAWYGRMIFPFLLWVLLAAIARTVLPELANVRGPNGIPLFVLKAGDVTVHLTGIAGFLALKLNDVSARPAHRVYSGWHLWVLVSFAVLFYGSQNRGGLLAFGIGTALVAMFGSKRMLLKVLVCLVALFLGFTTFDYEIEIGSLRKVSPQQLIENVRSIGKEDHSPFEGTKRWRLAWWRRIIDYTVFGPYRWSGRGFGVNLADEDGFQTGPAGLLRSPHSAHFTFLARAGLPGLALWLLVLALFAGAMMKGILDTTGALRRVMVWILIYWVAVLVNASFDVYLEGPQGGVWFWCLLGLGISATQVGRQEFQSRQIRPAT
jgi:hypothetical protein